MSRSAERIAIAASEDFLSLDASWPVLEAALRDERFVPLVVPWDASNVDWSSFAVVLVSYAWGYVTRRLDFLDWAEEVSRGSRLVNSPALLRWNSDKSYLSDLADHGVAIVPTSIAEPGASWHRPSADYVIKPSVSSGAIGAARYRESDLSVADEHVRRLHASGQTVLVQPYQQSVDERGETAMVFLDGQMTHAVSKQALLVSDVGEVDRLWEREVITPVEARDDQRTLAETALRVVKERFGAPVYARVDVVDDGDSQPRVLEVELIEPSLFLPSDGAAARRLAQCLYSVVDSLRPDR